MLNRFYPAKHESTGSVLNLQPSTDDGRLIFYYKTTVFNNWLNLD